MNMMKRHARGHPYILNSKGILYEKDEIIASILKDVKKEEGHLTPDAVDYLHKNWYAPDKLQT